MKWWCHQTEAREDFRKWLLARYENLDGVCKAWVGSATCEEALASAPHNLISLPGEDGFEQYFSDAEGLPPSHQKRFVDFSTWYAEALEKYVEFWLQRARHHRPKGRIALLLAGDGHPMTGARFPQLVALASRYKAEIRYAPLTQSPARIFAMSSLVTTAARFYHVPLTLDASGCRIPEGLNAIIAYATSLNVQGLSTDAIFRSDTDKGLSEAQIAIDIIRHYLTQISTASPHIETAILLSERQMAVNHRLLLDWQGHTTRLRDTVDLAVFTENLIDAETLQGYRFLISPPDALLSDDVLEKVEDFIERGGIWIAHRSVPPKDFIAQAKLSETDAKGVYGLGEGFLALVPGEASVNRYGNERFAKDVGKILKRRGPWVPLQFPSLDTDGVFVTQRDESILVWNTLPTPTRIRLVGLESLLEIGGGEMKSVTISEDRKTSP